MKVNSGNISGKKELGQFFSGKAIATLLANLASSKTAKTIIDPMCGTGDMLLACIEDNPQAKFYGIEIDKEVFLTSLKNFRNVSHVSLKNEDVFHSLGTRQLDPLGYDLVITNPPYVRYQSIPNKNKSSPFNSLSLIRNQLKGSLTKFKTITENDKKGFEVLISEFSGLSDLAVPAWLACALLVKEGGTLAMVVPETWLNRNYALVVKYLLLRLFKIEFLVEDSNACWFKPAQVKTNLLVAKRIKSKNSIFEWNDEVFDRISISSKAKTDSSLIGNVFPRSKSPEKEFLKYLNTHKKFDSDLCQSKKVALLNFAKDLKSVASNQKWFKILEPTNASTKLVSNGIKVSSELREWCIDSSTQFNYLSDIGVNISQGLRTGANKFFYMDFDQIDVKCGRVYPNYIFKLNDFLLSNIHFKPVLRKQSELDDSFSLNNFTPKGIVLYINDYALPEDILKISDNPTQKTYRKLPNTLNRYIRVAEKTYITTTSKQLIPELSAVKPNSRKGHTQKGTVAPRFWYMLPPFTKRHFPDLFVPRVNSGACKTRLNKGGKYIIDANFSSIWLDSESDYDVYSLLALLNSSWAVTAMEEYGTVLGGGALKLDAIQIKNIPFPKLDGASIEVLAQLGKELSNKKANYESLLFKIDTLIIKSFGFISTLGKLEQLHFIKRTLLEKRTLK